VTRVTLPPHNSIYPPELQWRWKSAGRELQNSGDPNPQTPGSAAEKAADFAFTAFSRDFAAPITPNR
jgi:hypothetical protein